MGEYADYELDKQERNHWKRMEIAKIKHYLSEYKKTVKTWNTKDHGEILITDMDDSHIKNCINLLKKRNRYWLENDLEDYPFGTFTCKHPVAEVLEEELESRKQLDTQE